MVSATEVQIKDNGDDKDNYPTRKLVSLVTCHKVNSENHMLDPEW